MDQFWFYSGKIAITENCDGSQTKHLGYFIFKTRNAEMDGIWGGGGMKPYSYLG